MEETKLEYKGPEKKFKLFTMGLNLEVQPYWLIQQVITKNSQSMLDEMIAEKFKAALNAFLAWENQVLATIGVSDDDGEIEFEKNKYEVHIKEIQNVADISRDLLPLHTDWESIELTEDEQSAVERAYAYWKYNKFYGHKLD